MTLMVGEPERTNFITYSNDFTDPSWLFSSGVRSRTLLAPDATVTGTKVAGPVGGASGPIYKELAAPSAAVALSVYTKWVSGAKQRQFLIRNLTTATNFTLGTFDFDTGFGTTAINGGWSAEAVGDGWHRLKFIATTGITPGDDLRVYMGQSATSTAENGEWGLWGAQLEDGASVTSLIPTVGAPVTRSEGPSTAVRRLALPVQRLANRRASPPVSRFAQRRLEL